MAARRLKKSKLSSEADVTPKDEATSDPPKEETNPDFELATGSPDGNVHFVLLTDLFELVRTASDRKKQEKNYKTVVALLKGIKPRGEVEGMLAVQMVATHTTVMECLGRAAQPNQTLEGRDLNLRHAEKLLGLYARQVEVLDKHRGKGQQKMTVKHITVNQGGQAMVGNVQSNAPSAESSALATTPPALVDQSDTALEMDLLATKKKTPARRKK